MPGSLDCLSAFPDASTDCLLAANVLAYFTDREEGCFYREARRLIRPGGSLVV